MHAPPGARVARVDGGASEGASRCSSRTRPTLELEFDSVGVHTVEIRAPASAAAAAASASFSVHVRRVRRELRALSDAERERFLSALHHVYTVPQAEGEARWGARYRSAAWLVREHLYGAADASCDHWHDDAGMLHHHVGITWQLEQSLAAIDGGLAAHYWDYTVDAAARAAARARGGRARSSTTRGSARS